MKKTTQLPWLSPFSSHKGLLTVGGIGLDHIEKLVGGTPFYAYDKKIVAQAITQLQSILPNEIQLHYAIKANPLPSLINFLTSKVQGFDVASKQEMLLALQSGMPSDAISFAGPGKSSTDIEAAIIAGVTLHIESTTELNRAITLSKALAIKPHIALRINPEFELKASGMKMAGGAKPFGIDEEELPKLLTTIPYNDVYFRGFHIFAGSQNLNASALIDMHNQTFQLAEKLIKLTPVTLDYINIGGGLGIPYFPNEKTLDTPAVGENLHRLIKKHKEHLKNTSIVMELGRYLVGEAGIYVCKVTDKKTSRGTTYLVCDGGLHHHLANSGNFGQVLRRNYPISIGNKMDLTTNEMETSTIVGPSCTPLDILADKVLLPIAEINDYIVIYQSGAYGASASPQKFLSHPELYEIIL